MIKQVIEFCASNTHHGTDRVMEKLEDMEQFTVIEYGCLGNCGECYLLPYALVNGTIVSVQNMEQLFDRILAETIEKCKD
ncbi:YuzB family protein [Paenibacillus yanchengensis]|uniref:YuzB family protein n=1 Tax=Paenibacillus yanchengensis TaxID=2035833 RepID=A0ABW4YQB4_9BACL